MDELILFFLTFLLLFMIYQIFLIGPLKEENLEKRKNKKKSDKELLEIKYLKSKYDLDFNKIKRNQLLQLCAITSSLDMAIAVTVVAFIKSFLWEIVVGFVVVVSLIYISYYLIYLFYKKKGMVKNGKHK
ncbi:MAG: hypothetical protein IKQ06_01765 [Bacilli bacterium]|nr:hypothetical protein [Bacilli bacterium]